MNDTKDSAAQLSNTAAAAAAAAAVRAAELGWTAFQWKLAAMLEEQRDA